jgi:hypothetical protein
MQRIINAAYVQRSLQLKHFLLLEWATAYQSWGQCMFGAPEHFLAFGPRTFPIVIPIVMVQDLHDKKKRYCWLYCPKGLNKITITENIEQAKVQSDRKHGRKKYCTWRQSKKM